MLGLTRELPRVFVMSDRSCLISLADRVELVLVSFIWVVCWLVCGLVGFLYVFGLFDWGVGFGPYCC